MYFVVSFILTILTLLPRSSAHDLFDIIPNQNIARTRVVDKFQNIHTVLIEEYEFVSRTAATVAIPYISYRDVSVLHYEMPSDVAVAMFSFQVKDIIESANFGKCEPEDLIIHLKHGSYPAVNPDGYAFPNSFINENNREKIHTVQLNSTYGNLTYTVTNPKPGGWYATTYIKLKKSMKIEQKDSSQCDMKSEISPHKIAHLEYNSEFFIKLNLTPSFFKCLSTECDAILYTDLQVKRFNVEIVNCYSNITVHIKKTPVLLKCMIKDHVDVQTVNIKINKYPNDTRKVIVKIQALTIPSEEVIVKCYINLAMADFQRISFQPFLSAWHYILIDKALEAITNVIECNNSNVVSEKYAQYELIDLTRESKGISFNFDYNLPSTILQKQLNFINISSIAITILRFNIQPTLDIGGTLRLSASLMLPEKNKKKRSIDSTLLKFTESDPFLKVVVCQDIAHSSIPLLDGSCSFNGVIKPAMLLFNSKNDGTIKDSVMVPFPESGAWYLSIRLFCDGKDVGNDPLKDEYRNTSSAIILNSRHEVFECGCKMKFLVSSMPCVLGKCSNRGKCLLITSGSEVFSSCYCNKGYRGWDCSDETKLESPVLSILLLTLSSLVFILPIFIAFRRKYYSEAIVYTFTMVTSTFYHACDAPKVFAFCVFDIKILKFGDFYSGIMSIWMTCMCMSVLKRDIRSAFHVAGAVVIACLVNWNMEDVLSTAVPVSCGITCIIVSWIVDYKKTNTLFYPPSYYKIYLPTGVVFVAVGVMCFTFWETEDNYKYLHSLWHVLIALALACLLPRRRSTVRFN